MRLYVLFHTIGTADYFIIINEISTINSSFVIAVLYVLHVRKLGT